MSINAIGFQALRELHAAVRDAGGNPPVVIDSDDLAARPGATMAAYCAAVGLPFIPRALSGNRNDSTSPSKPSSRSAHRHPRHSPEPVDTDPVPRHARRAGSAR